MTKSSITIFLIFTVFYILGHFGPSYLNGDTCLRFLGCNHGPLGYDAFLHVISGVLFVVGTLWLIKKFPRSQLFSKRLLLNMFVLLSIVTFYSVIWEIIEYTHDSIRLSYNPTFPQYALDQPTNADTMGDLIVSLITSTATIVVLKDSLTPAESLS